MCSSPWRLGFDECKQSLPVPRVRHLRASPDTRAGGERQARGLADLLERERIEPRRNLALEPRLVALVRMLARPAAIATMPFADRLASRAVHVGAAPWVVASFGLRGERPASRFDRSQPMSRRSFGIHASQWRRLRLSTGSPHIAHAIALAGRASTVGVRHTRVAYGRGREALRGVAHSGDGSDAEAIRRFRCSFTDRLRGAAPLVTRDSRKLCARRAAIGRRHSR
jgi:hypothetical protein